MEAIPPLFGVVIPGRPVITEFQALDSTKAVTIIQNPSTVSDLTFFLLPAAAAAIPSSCGAILYYSTPPYNTWEIIGSVSLEKPSGVFRTSWSTNEIVAASHFLQLGVSIEP